MNGKQAKLLRKAAKILSTESDMPEVEHDTKFRNKNFIVMKAGKPDIKEMPIMHVTLRTGCARWHYQKLKAQYKAGV